MKTIAILLQGEIWPCNRFSFKETTTVLMDDLSEAVGVGNAAARVWGLTVRDEGAIRSEPFLTTWATALIGWMSSLKVLLILGCRVEVFSASVLAKAMQRRDVVESGNFEQEVNRP
jgi:hypothetical protein